MTVESTTSPDSATQAATPSHPVLGNVFDEINNDESIWDEAWEGATFTPAASREPQKPANLTADLPPAPATEGSNEDEYVDKDTAGLPHDERIHATPKKKNKSNGQWAKKKGVDEAEYEKVLAELRVKYPEPKKKERDDSVETFWANHVATLSWGIFYEDKVTPVPYKWGGKCWQPMTDDDIMNEAERFLFARFKSAYSDGKKKSCVGLTTSILHRTGKILQPPKNRSIISVEGGYLEILVDGSIRWMAHDKALFIRNFINAPIFRNHADQDCFYVPTPQDTIEKRDRGLLGRLIQDSFEDVDVRRAFQEHIGDTLLPENSQVTPFLIGSGGQGKSQWVELMMGVHTHHAVADLSNLKGFALSNFIGSSLLVVDEAEKRIDEQAFKRIFGGGVGVQVDRKFKTPLTWKPDIKGFVALNEMPTFSEHSEAIQRRICPYPMTKAMHTSKDRVKDIGKKILEGYKVAGKSKGEEVYVKDQRRDLLDWLLAGAVRVVKQGGLRPEDQMPLKCRMEKAQLRHETEPVWAFIKELEWAPMNGKGGITKAEIYGVYVDWCKDNGRTGIMGSHRFGKDLKRNIEKEFGKGTLSEGKISVRVPNSSETAWKTSYRLKAANGAGYEIKYGEYFWDEEAIAKRDADIKAAAEASEKAAAAAPPPSDEADDIPF